MRCNYRFCKKEIKYGRPDRKFCNKECRIKENNIIKELKSLNRKYIKTREFISKSQLKHSYKYDYSLVVYENCRTKIKIICPIHGIFEQIPSNHLYNGYGCEKCARENRRLIPNC